MAASGFSVLSKTVIAAALSVAAITRQALQNSKDGQTVHATFTAENRFVPVRHYIHAEQ